MSEDKKPAQPRDQRDVLELSESIVSLNVNPVLTGQILNVNDPVPDEDDL